MRTLVVGGTGTVGSEVVQQLLTRNDGEVAVLTRDAGRAAALPQGVDGFVADLQDPIAAAAAFTSADSVFLALTGTPSETYEALAAVELAVRAGVQRLVYLSVHDLDREAQVPHNGAKLAVENAILRSGMSHCFLRANNFFQNDLWFKDAILAGTYPQPIGETGISRVDVRDIAEAGAIALIDKSLAGPVDLVGPDACTGSGTAAAWSAGLGTSVVYAGDDLKAWERQNLAVMPPWLVFDYRVMYDGFQRRGLLATDAAVERLAQVLGHAPRTFDAYVQETVQSWAAA